MEYQGLNEIVSEFKNAQILCVGDIMLDRFVYGAVDRISPEGPIPVLKINRENDMLGGVGNVVANVAALGASVRAVAVIGQDDAGQAVQNKMRTITGDTAGLVVSENRPTTIKTRYMASNQQLLRTDSEIADDISQDIQINVLSAVRTHLETCDVVVLSDYGKGVLIPAITTQIIQMAQAQGKPVIVDPKGRDYTKYRGASLVTPNRNELAQATDMATQSDDDVRTASLKLVMECGIAAVLATRSQDGMSVIAGDAPPVHLPTIAQEVFDVSGAGDTVVATMAVGLATGANLEQSARLANIAGGIVVGKIGTATVTTAELENGLTQQTTEKNVTETTIIAPALTLEQVVEQAERWRAEGKTVGFANGCFDLLHPGHVSLMAQAAGECDRLIVAMNSDASVRKLKGENRPVQDEMARATVLGALGMVDAVVIFGEDTPINLIKAINPDVLVKGEDYTVETVVGSEHVLSYGGRVFLAKLEDGRSTTKTVEKLSA